MQFLYVLCVLLLASTTVALAKNENILESNNKEYQKLLNVNKKKEKRMINIVFEKLFEVCGITPCEDIFDKDETMKRPTPSIFTDKRCVYLYNPKNKKE